MPRIPQRNFLPSIGRLVRYRPPPERSRHGISLRNDTGVYEGGEISLYYDPMIAKLITHAPTRAQAIAAQADALDAFTIDGFRHNISFLSALMQHPRWQAGRLSTAFLAEEFPDGLSSAPADRGDRARAGGGGGRRRSRGRREASAGFPASGRGRGPARAAPGGAVRRRRDRARHPA